MKMKMIEVSWITHRNVKRQAKEKGVSMREYVKMLVSNDIIKSSVNKDINNNIEGK